MTSKTSSAASLPFTVLLPSQVQRRSFSFKMASRTDREIKIWAGPLRLVMRAAVFTVSRRGPASIPMRTCGRSRTSSDSLSRRKCRWI